MPSKDMGFHTYRDCFLCMHDSASCSSQWDGRGGGGGGGGGIKAHVVSLNFE